jgi:hypothetical protein
VDVQKRGERVEEAKLAGLSRFERSGNVRTAALVAWRVKGRAVTRTLAPGCRQRACGPPFMDLNGSWSVCERASRASKTID